MAHVEELVPLVGVSRACATFGVPRASFYRHRKPSHGPRLTRPRPSHPRALRVEEQQAVSAQLNAERFVDCGPRTVYATLLDEGVYLCHWRTMYRLLAREHATRERRAIRPHAMYARPELLATAPNQVWSWDITKLRGPHAGIWYSLYVVLDIFSRAVVGWHVAEREDAELAEHLIADACAREAIAPTQLTLHADRGAPMTSKTVAELLLDLGVAKSHSRPRISNDNPYSEAQFKTMKYGPTYPDRFADLAAAKNWVAHFVAWYNVAHRHSGIGLLPPMVVHRGQARAAVAGRQHTLDVAAAVHPERFVAGRPTPPCVPDAVWINPPIAGDSLQTLRVPPMPTTFVL